MAEFDIDIGTDSDIEEEIFKPMTFKESVDTDVRNTFFNLDEFAYVHSINDKDIPVVVDEDKINELVESKFTPLDRVYEKMILFYVQKEALEFIPKVNSSLFFDNEMYQVVDVSDDDFGILTVNIGKISGR